MANKVKIKNEEISVSDEAYALVTTLQELLQELKRSNENG